MNQEEWQEILPSWGSELARIFPSETLAAYVSFSSRADLGEEPEQKLTVFVVTPRSLVGYEIEAEVKGDPRGVSGRVATYALPVRSIHRVRTNARFFKSPPGELRTRAEGVLIELQEDYGPLRTLLELPFDPANDYGGQSQLAQKAAWSFGEAVLRVFGQRVA